MKHPWGKGMGMSCIFAWFENGQLYPFIVCACHAIMCVCYFGNLFYNVFYSLFVLYVLLVGWVIYRVSSAVNASWLCCTHLWFQWPPPRQTQSNSSIDLEREWLTCPCVLLRTKRGDFVWLSSEDMWCCIFWLWFWDDRLPSQVRRGIERLIDLDDLEGRGCVIEEPGCELIQIPLAHMPYLLRCPLRHFLPLYPCHPL